MNPVVRQAAVELVASQFPVDCTSLTDEALIKLIEGLFLGGWERFVREHTPLPQRPSGLTEGQMLREIHRVTGWTISLGMFEEIEKINLEEERIIVLIRSARVTERRHEYIIRQQGHRLITMQYKEADGECWWEWDEMTVWDDPQDVTYKRGDRVRSVRESYDQLEWERMCYRPGTSRTPLDNYFATDNPKMEKHWGA